MEGDSQDNSSNKLNSSRPMSEEWKENECSASFMKGNNIQNNAILSGAKYIGDVKDTAEFQFFHFDNMPVITAEHTSMMAKTLTPQLYLKLKDQRTAQNFTLSNAITPGILDPHSDVGVIAGDEECWTVYKDLYYPIIKIYHRYDPYYSKQYHDLDLSKISFPPEQLELFNRHIVFSKLSVTRNVAGFPYPAANTLAERERLEQIIIQSCHTLQDNYPGVYFPLEVLSTEQQQTLYDHGFLPHPTPALTNTGATRDWPYHRGVYLSHDQNIILWLNEEHHCRLFAQQMTGNLLEIFRQLYDVDHLISSGLQRIVHVHDPTAVGYAWAWENSLGYLSSSPANLGTGLLFSIFVSLPEFSKLHHNTEQQWKDPSITKILFILCMAHDLLIVSTPEPSTSFTVFNQHIMGLSEIQILQSMIDGIAKVLQYEQLLASGVYPTIVCELIRRELAATGRYAFSKEESLFSGGGGNGGIPTTSNTAPTISTGDYYLTAQGEMVITPSPLSHDYFSPHTGIPHTGTTAPTGLHTPHLTSIATPMLFPMQLHNSTPGTPHTGTPHTGTYPTGTYPTSTGEEDMYNDPNYREPCHIPCVYKKKQAESVSYKPILSVGHYVSLDIDCVVAGSSDRKIRFYDSQTLEEIGSTVVDKKNVNFVAISEMSAEGDDPVIVTGGKDSSIQVWNPVATGTDTGTDTGGTGGTGGGGNIDKTITLPTMEVRSIAIYQGTVRIYAAIGTKDGKVFVWDVQHDLPVVHFPGHKASVHCVCISLTCPTDQLTGYGSSGGTEDDLTHLCVASGSADRTARTWNVKTSMPMKRFHHARSISSILITSKSVRPLLVTAGVERSIKLWDLTSGVLLRVFLGHLDQINSLALWEGCQMLLISGSSDATIRVYDMLTGENIAVLTGHRDAVLSLTVASLDTPTIVSSSEDLSLIQWDLQQLITDYYFTDHAEENVGLRRSEVIPVLPTIYYRAPEELDRNRLSKDERKRIRRERKKQQRLKNLLNDWKAFKNAAAVSAASSAASVAVVKDSSMDTNHTSTTNADTNTGNAVVEDTGMDMSVVVAAVDEEALKKAALAAGIEPIDEARIEQEILQLQERIDKHPHPHTAHTAHSHTAHTHIAHTAHIVEIGGHEASSTTTSAPHNNTASTPSLILPKTKSQMYLHTLQSSSQQWMDGILKSAIRKVVPVLHTTTTATSTTTSEPRHTTTSSTTSSTSSLPSLKKVLGFSSTVAIEPIDNLSTMSATTKTSSGTTDMQHGVVEAKESTSKPNSSSGTLTSSSSRKTPPNNNNNNNKPSELSFKLQAQATQNKYNVAVAEHTLQTDRKRNAASEKLALRLQLKKKLQQGDGEDEDTTVSTPTTSMKTAGELTEQQLHELKAEKLKQHKLQETRRHQSMAIAKKRSENALQKRLEDLANKKRLADAAGGNENEKEDGRERTVSMAIEEGDEEGDETWEDGDMD